MTTSPPSPEHGIMTYLRMDEKLSNLGDLEGIPMEIDTPLSKALDAVSCIPFVQFSIGFPCTYSLKKFAFTIGDTHAGSLGHPDVDLILQKSTPSAFGRGSETVMDPSYRSGREIPAANIAFENDLDKFLKRIMESTKMFPGRQIELKLYKLAVYETGGHFDWHMDSTHSDKHHATLLVALNSSWKGGDLVLRRNEVETHVDLRPEPESNDNQNSEPILRTVAFFTDTEHRVEPVTEGIRIVLQYDIEVEEKEEAEDEGREDSWEPWLAEVHSDYSNRMDIQGATQAAADKAAVEKVIAIITELHKSGVEEVAFALQYLYRKASIRPEYLKGPDALLYNALMASGAFDVSLHPVVLREISQGDDGINEHYAHRFDDTETDTNASSDSTPPKKKKKKKKSSAFHIPKLSAIQEISSRDYVEHTGNESMEAEYRYFGGGMYVCPKAQ